MDTDFERVENIRTENYFKRPETPLDDYNQFYKRDKEFGYDVNQSFELPNLGLPKSNCCTIL